MKIELSEKQITITLHDNGEGFNKLNRKAFTHLDYKNLEKEKLKLFPQGQGRLSIVYFSDSAIYHSIYLDESGHYKENTFPYPEIGNTLFDIEAGEGCPTTETETGTLLTITINKHNTLSRANTFFLKYLDKERLEVWFINNFFPFFMEFPTLELIIKYTASEDIKINKAYIEKSITSIPFSVNDLTDGQNFDFKVWVVSIDSKSKFKNSILCYARHLRAELVNGRLEYEIDLPSDYYWIITSDFLDSFVDSKGDKIEIANEDIEKIQFKLNLTLNEHYHSQIESNKRETKSNIAKATVKYPSLKDFVDQDNIIQTRKILKEHEIINTAIENKGRIEKTYWNNSDLENEEIDRLINSSLHIYVAHRSRVLNKFHDMILRFDNEGEKKSEPEDDIHDLFLRRGEKLSTSENINHLHNLWILDDKFTVFSETNRGLSSKRGQELSDIYLWIDDPEKINELLILELKSTTNAHNAGDRYESMVAQVKRYAAQFYREPTKILAWDVDPSKILFSGIILARKSDINKELNSNNTSGIAHKIPYLNSSYFYNERFSTAPSDFSVPIYNEIRIELLAFEDVYELAKNRNKVFFKLLNGEYKIAET